MLEVLRTIETLLFKRGLRVVFRNGLYYLRPLLGIKNTSDSQ